LEDDYIEPQHYEFTVMGQVTRTYESFSLGSNGQSIKLSPDGQLKAGPYFGWRWIFLGYTFAIDQLGFDSGGLRKEFDISIYSSQVGIDFYYRRTGDDYKIRDVKLGYGIDGNLFENIPFSGVNVGITGLSAYYIFNHGRFSYPAAFGQSTCQKISCGSWLAGAGYTNNTLDLDYEHLHRTLNSRLPVGEEVKLDSGLMFKSVKYNDFMLSGGYAYNWVFARNWLLCASLSMALAYKTSMGKTESKYDTQNNEGFDFGNFNIDGIGRFGVVWNNTKWYAGASAIVRAYNYRKSRFAANNIFGDLSIYVGLNFGPRGPYKKKKNKE
jgi:hypothetical protein